MSYEGTIPAHKTNRGAVVSISSADIENSVSKVNTANIITIAKIKSMLMRKRSSRFSNLVPPGGSGTGSPLSQMMSSVNSQQLTASTADAESNIQTSTSM